MSRRTPARNTPRDLPKLRDQLVRHLNNPEMPVRSKTGTENRPGLDALSAHLRDGGLYWVTADMAALAMSAGSQLDTARWANADRPTSSGLIVWDGGVGHVEAHGAKVPVEACAWGTFDGQCLLWVLMARRRLADQMAERGLALAAELIPPLIPVAGYRLPVTTHPVPLGELAWDAPKPVVAAVAAAWLLMQQPTLVERSQQYPDRSVRRAYARQDRPAPEVTIVDLRPAYTPRVQPEEVEGDPRRYRVRWVVSGHWRDQPYGPERSLRRRQWIPAYVKGPDGAPLLATEKVNVWRR